MKNQRNHAPQHVALILALAGFMSAAALVLATPTLASAQTIYPSWSYTGNLHTARRWHTATLLSNGKVLVAGGFDPNTCSTGSCLVLNTTELYDPATGTWSSTGNLNKSREGHSATLLPNGKVLVVGGNFNANNSAELYDPATGTWTITGNLNGGVWINHTATLLTSGKVLVAGGSVDSSFVPDIKRAELYDPTTGMWSITGNLGTGRANHTATLLPSGNVLVAEGFHCSSSNDCLSLKSAELYDPATGTWSNTSDVNPLILGTSTLLANGKVLLAGSGFDGSNSAELYDPNTGTWGLTGNLNYARGGHKATLLPNGNVLVTGGSGFDFTLSSAELYDPTAGSWAPTAYLNSARWFHTATLLPNGKVLVAGGTDSELNSAELYDPSSSPNINSIDDAQFFVHQHYIDFLNREPDVSGLAFWTNQITSCGNDAQCIELKHINVSAAFFLSIEFQETGYFVYRVNKAAHGNLPGLPVPIKLNEFLPEMAEVSQGVIVGQPGWQQILESHKQVFFVNDPENDRWTSAYPSSMTPSAFVDTLFANAEVIPSASDRAAAINEFGSATNTDDLSARARALRRVAENSTFAQQEFNRGFVLVQYFGYLRRNPNDPPEPTLDFQGYNFWLTKLNQFNGNFINAEMVKAFIISTEYRERFGQP